MAPLLFCYSFFLFSFLFFGKALVTLLPFGGPLTPSFLYFCAPRPSTSNMWSWKKEMGQQNIHFPGLEKKMKNLPSFLHPPKSMCDKNYAWNEGGKRRRETKTQKSWFFSLPRMRQRDVPPCKNRICSSRYVTIDSSWSKVLEMPMDFC